MDDYIRTWYDAAREGRTGYSVFTATELYNEIIASMPPAPFPVSIRKFGLDIAKYPFILKKKSSKHNLYSVNWDYISHQPLASKCSFNSRGTTE
jgi:hypothetical protein